MERLKNKIKQLRLFIKEGVFLHDHRRQYLNQPTKDFTRKRKLDFSIIVTLILRLNL